MLRFDTEKYATLALRIGLGFVFLFFGIDKFIDPIAWQGWVTPSLNKVIESIMPVRIFIYLLGVEETLVGAMLIIGLFWRLASLAAASQLLAISITVGYNDVTLRDLGLLAAALALAMHKTTRFAIDNKREERRRFKVT